MNVEIHSVVNELNHMNLNGFLEGFQSCCGSHTKARGMFNQLSDNSQVEQMNMEIHVITSAVISSLVIGVSGALNLTVCLEPEGC